MHVRPSIECQGLNTSTNESRWSIGLAKLHQYIVYSARLTEWINQSNDNLPHIEVEQWKRLINTQLFALN